MEQTKNGRDPMMAVWLSMSAPVVYIIICEAIYAFGVRGGPFHGYSPLPAATYNLVKIAFYLLSAIIAIMIGYTRADIKSGNISGLSSMFLNVVKRSGENTLQAVVQSLIMITAFCNSVAIYGVLLVLLNGVRSDGYPLIGAGFALMLLFIPSPRLVEKMSALKKP